MISGLKLCANNKIKYYILITKGAFDSTTILLTRVVNYEFISMTLIIVLSNYFFIFHCHFNKTY